MNLLLIEQSTLLSERLARILTTLDCVKSVKIADTIGEALREMQLIRPEIVVVDPHLPNRSGVEALVRVKAECPSACVIVLTYESSEWYRKYWRQAGADYCFDISIQLDLLLDAVRLTAIAPYTMTGKELASVYANQCE